MSAYRRWRAASLGTGIILLLWLPIEDTHLAWVILFAVLVSLLIVIRLLLTRKLASKRSPWALTLAGLSGGLLVAPAALSLMAFKSGFHGHGFPDFTPEQVTTVLQNIPLWAFAGLLAGVGLALLKLRTS